MPADVRYVPCGDAALTLHFDEPASPALARRIAALHAALRVAPPRYALESIPGVVTLTVLYDPRRSDASEVERCIERCRASLRDAAPPPKTWEIPVCYEGDLAPDLASVAHATGLDERAVAQAHRARDYTVYLLGFSPGFPYMGEIDPRLALPRRAEPRARVRAGSVAIATAYTAIYPQATAGGWHVIGATPLALFDPQRAPPALLAPGDGVRFVAIDRDTFDRMEAGEPPRHAA